MKNEKLYNILLRETNSTKGEILLELAEMLSDILLSTDVTTLDSIFRSQHNRLKIRKLRSVLDTLQKLGFLKFPN